MRILKLTTLALALAGALPTQAAEPALDVKKELQALKDKVAELEARQKAAPAPAPAAGAAGMTAEEKSEFNRIAVKTEAMEDSRDASGLKGLKISGYADPTYIYNLNKERGSFQFLSTTEGYGYDNSYIGSVSLDLVKETDSGVKFHLNLIPARSTGSFTDSTIVNEASVWIPIGSDMKLFGGQIADWSGYEYQSPVLYKNVTHNLLFDFTLPFYYTGVGVEFLLGKLDLKLMAANFNQTIRQVGESTPMFVFRGDYTGGEYWGLGFAGAVGNKNNFRATGGNVYFVDPVTGENNNPDAYSTKDTLYTTLEVDGWYTRADWTFNGHATYGAQQKAAISEDPTTGALRDSQWIGVSALAAYKATQRTELVLRADYLYNRKNGGGLMDWVAADGSNGIGPDLAGDLEKGADKYAVTAGLNYSVNANVYWRLEYRYDGATQKVFQKNSDGSYVKSNSLIGSSLVFFF